MIRYAAEFSMRRARILNVSIAVNHVHFIVGSQNSDRNKYAINCAAITIANAQFTVLHEKDPDDVKTLALSKHQFRQNISAAWSAIAQLYGES